MKYALAAGPTAFGYLNDPFTPLRHWLPDSLHLILTVCGYAFNLYTIGAQRVENLHPGYGIYCLAQSLRYAGLPHEAKYIEKEARLKLGDKLKTFVSCGDQMEGLFE